MALGAVATGSINAQEAATVAANIKLNGWTSIIWAMDAKIGRIIVAVATLEVISVKKFTRAVTARMMIISSIP